jgi:hypothetical protein
MHPYRLSVLSGNTFQAGDVSIRVRQAKNVTIIVNSQVGNTAVVGFPYGPFGFPF